MKNFVFDIETVPLPTDQLESIIPPFDPESVKVGNLGSDKAIEKIEKMRQEHFSRFYRRAALSAITGQIAMIGITDGEEPHIWQGDEMIMIYGFFDMFERQIDKGAHWIGFNIASFDLPFLIRRAWFHRLSIPYGIVRGRYLTNFFTDLSQLWTGSQYGNHFDVSLNDLAQFFGLGTKTANGADFGELLRYNPEAAKAYLENDLEITWKIAERMGALKGPDDKPAEAIKQSDPGPTIDPIEAPGSQIQFY